MKRAVYKYDIGFLERQTVDLPRHADIVRVDVVDGRPYLWALVSTDDSDSAPRTIVGLKTGAIASGDEDLRFIGWAAINIQMELALYFFEVCE